METRNIEVREAGFSDYQEVMRIDDNIYNGRDYLGIMYYVLMRDTNSNCFVILLNGRIVSIKTKRKFVGGNETNLKK